MKNDATKKFLKGVIAFLLTMAFLPWIRSDVNATDLSNVIAQGSSSQLTPEEMLIYSQNDIIFPTPNCVESGGISSVCGDTPKEMYWSALSQYVDDPIKVAGIMGNLAAEGLFQPVLWEIGYSAPWDVLYNCGDGTCPFGVGAFGFTYHLGKYLHAVNDANPDLLKYFQDRDKYSIIDANEAMEKIGKEDFARLVEFEVKYAIEDWEPSTTQEYLSQNFSSPSEAAYWWMDRWERPGVRTPEVRESAAEKAYKEFKDFTCTPSSTTSASTSAAAAGTKLDVTLIGDSIAVQAEAELQSKFPGAFFSKVGSRHSTSGGVCSGDSGGLTALEKIIAGNGEVADQHASGECVVYKVGSDSLKENVVWELGTNTGGASEATIEKVIKLIGQRKLFLVTPYNGNDSAKSATDGIAKMYREVADKYDNVYIVDWNESVRNDESKYVVRESGMTVHPTADGRKLLADLIYGAIDGAGSCVSASHDKIEDYPQYYQCSGPWSGLTYGVYPPFTFCMNGCGAASMAMLATEASGQEVTPTDVVNTAVHVYNQCSFDCMYDNDKAVGDRYGFEVEKGSAGGPSELEAKMREYLKNGYMVHLVGSGGPAYYGLSHYLGIYKIDDNDNVYVADSNGGNYVAKLAKIVNDGASWFTVIKNKSGNACLSTCDNKVGSVDGGLSEAEAQKIVDYYKSNKVDPDEWGLPFGKANCVSLSVWFVEALTSIGKNPNIVDNGDGVAHQTAIVGNLEEGNEPRPFAVFSTTDDSLWCGDSPCGHTGIVVGVNGDDIMTIEAVYGGTMGVVVHRDKSYYVNSKYGKAFTYLEPILNKTNLASIIGR